MWRWRLLAPALACACVIVAGPGDAEGSNWRTVKLPDPSIQVALYGVSCASRSLCAAGGANSTIAASRDPAAGSGAWDVFRAGGGVGSLPFGNDAIYAGGQIRGVSCPSTDLCVAVSFDGRIFSSRNPAGGGSTWNIVPLSEEKKPRVHMGGVSCPSVSLCVAVAYGGEVVASTDPTGDRSAWTVTQLGRPFDLRGVSCPSAGLCVAVGNEGEIVTSTNPIGAAPTWELAGTPAGPHSMNGVSCPTVSLCVTGSAGGIVVSTNPAVASSWNVVSPGTGLPVKGVSCPSASACAAIDNNADVIASTQPTGGPGAWWFENVLPFGSEAPGQGNGMFSISCPAMSLCVAVGQDSQVVTSTNPFVRAVARIPSVRRTRRPRVLITRHPPKRLGHRRGGVRVRFRFRVIGRAARLRCKIDRRPWRRCRSPKRYRVGAGKHVFRVRAIAPGGLKGPPTAFHFRVGRLSERPPTGSCPPPPPGLPPSGPCIPRSVRR